MPAKDIFHSNCKNALIKDGWTITHDPLSMKIGERDLFVDLGAEKFLTAEKGNQKIAVEVKSFINRSEMQDLENALGQFTFYNDVLELREPERILYLAVRRKVFIKLFENDEAGKLLLLNKRLRLIVFEEEKEEIVKWIT